MSNSICYRLKERIDRSDDKALVEISMSAEMVNSRNERKKSRKKQRNSTGEACVEREHRFGRVPEALRLES